MIRSIVAIVVGFVVIGALSVGTDLALRAALPGRFLTDRMDDPALLVLTLAYVFVFAVAGCWLTARLAPDRPLLHALVLGVLGLVLNVVGTALRWDDAPAWYHVIALLLVLPAAWLGGVLREGQQLARHGAQPVDGRTAAPLAR